MPLSPSTKTPQVSASITFGGSGAAPSSATKRILLIGSMITTALVATVNTASDATETVTTAAGTAILDRAVQCFSPDNAAALVGRGSELHRAAIAAFAQDRNAAVWLGPVTYGNTPVAASVTITPTVSGLSAGTLRVLVCGYPVEVAITSSDTVSTIGLKIARAINSARDLPVTAENTWSTGAVVLTAKCAGPRGMAISVRCELASTTQTREVINGTGVALFGLTITMSGGTVDGGTYRLASGSVDDNNTTLLANISGMKFDRIAFAGYRVSGSASGNLARLLTAVADQGGEAQMFDQQVVLGTIETLGNAITLSQGLNAERASWPWSYGVDDLPLEIAAQVAAGRLAGDSAVGGSVDGEATDPSTNLNGLELATLRVPRDPADVATSTEVETALNSGLSPLAPSGVRPGKMRLVASITGRSLNGSTPDYSVYKTKDVTVPDWARAEVIADLQTTYRGFRLVADPPNGIPPQQPKTTTPSAVRERIYGLLKRYEGRGILTEVDARRSQITVARNGSNPRRVDFSFPVVPTQDFDIATGTLHQLQPAG